MIAVALSLCLMLTTLCAVAESADVINWVDVEPQVAGLNGMFYTFDEVGIRMWTPFGMYSHDTWVDENDEHHWLFQVGEDLYNGRLYSAYGNGWLTVNCMPPSALGMDTAEAVVDDFAKFVAKESEMYANVKRFSLNGLDALAYDGLEDGTSHVVVVVPSGHVMEVFCYYEPGDDLEAVIPYIFASIQAE